MSLNCRPRSVTARFSPPKAAALLSLSLFEIGKFGVRNMKAENTSA
jgi:hypothetical protein